jgi:flagellar hook-associated protein FlgK
MACANTINESSGEQFANMNSQALTNSECWLSLMVKDQRVLKPMFLFFLPNVFDEKEVKFLLSSYSKEEITDNAQAIFDIAHRCDQVEVTQANKVQTSNEQFNAGYRCFLDRLQSFTQPESEESKANVDALVDYYAERQSLSAVHYAQF